MRTIKLSPPYPGAKDYLVINEEDWDDAVDSAEEAEDLANDAVDAIGE